MGIATKHLARQSNSGIPLLYSGDHLDQPEFLRRYEAYPDPDARFELIGGIVYMMSPAGFEHGSNEYRASGVLMWYEAHTAGVEGATGTTVILGRSSQPEPDALLMIRPEFGGQARVKKIKNKYYVAGAPELIWEVSHSSVAIDLNAKFADYSKAGVCEYVVHCLEEQKLRWFDLTNDSEIEADREGIFKSRLFPGLWVNLPALLARETQSLATTLEQGLETPEHAEFVAKLAAHRRRLRRRSNS